MTLNPLAVQASMTQRIEPPSAPTAAPRYRRGWPALLAILVIGIFCRAAVLPQPGHTPDTDLFRAWARNMAHTPLSEFFSKKPGCNYPPLYLYILGGMARATDALEPCLKDTLHLDIPSDKLLDMMIRLPACFADFLIALLLYFEVRRLGTPSMAAVAAALYFLNPTAIYNGAYWGQVDAIHSAFLLLALVALNRMNPSLCGVAVGLSLLQKLQSIAFLPLFIFDIYRWKRWKGLMLFVLGLGFSTAVGLSPFAMAGNLQTAMERGYVNVVGQYGKLTVKAFNPWYLLGSPETPNDSVPLLFAKVAGAGQDSVAVSDHPLLQVTWKRMSIGAFVLMVAVVLTLHARHTGAAARSLTAGLLGLAFFMALTEMHERYVHPVLALLPIWAVTSGWRERSYIALSILAFVNLIYVQPPDHIGPMASAMFTLATVVLLFSTAFARRSLPVGPQVQQEHVPYPSESAPATSWLVRGFGLLTVLALLAAVGGFAYIGQQVQASGLLDKPAKGESADDSTLYLSTLEPTLDQQGYGRLGRDHSLEGGPIQLGDRIYLRGLGTHSPATLEYDIPPGFTHFRALIGINANFGGSANNPSWATALVILDGKKAFESPKMSVNSPPMDIEVELGQARKLRLVVSPTDDGKKGDHMDWALARFTRETAAAAAPQ